MIVITWIVVGVLALVLYLRQVYTKFSKKQVNHLPPLPFFGNMFRAFFNLENVTETMSKLSKAFPDDKVVGMYEMTNALYVVQDVDTIKNVTIKDFDHFVDRRSFTNDLDPMFGRVLFSLKECVVVGEEMINVLSNRIKDSGGKHIDVNLKDLTTRYANDVIASCAFGLKVESQSGDSHFYQKAKDMTTFDVVRIAKVFIFRMFPYIAGKINLRLASPSTTNFFTDVVLATMVEREKKNISRPDMINILNEIKRGKHIDVNLKDLTTRYANDVIASCAFGLKVESQSGDSHFYQKAKDMTTFDVVRIAKVFIFRMFPYIAGKINLRLASPSTTNFFTDVVLATMVEREKKNISRPDMINILNEIKRGKLSHAKDMETDVSAGFATVEESGIGKKSHTKEWCDSDLVAQAVQFLFAGFDTISTAMSFIIHELATNPEIQERLVKEIDENDKKNNGKFDFNSIQNMKYIDMVVSETLRLYPPAPFLDRTCTKDYNFGRVNKNSSQDLIICKGDVIGYPIWKFHRDPQLFPNPDKFDPERFSEENSHQIKPFSYMPFGLGPRNCIGSRFALCEVKVMLYILLRNMKVTPCEKTTIPLELTPGFLMYIKDGGWVRLQLRN